MVSESSTLQAVRRSKGPGSRALRSLLLRSRSRAWKRLAWSYYWQSGCANSSRNEALSSDDSRATRDLCPCAVRAVPTLCIGPAIGDRRLCGSCADPPAFSGARRLGPRRRRRATGSHFDAPSHGIRGRRSAARTHNGLGRWPVEWRASELFGAIPTRKLGAPSATSHRRTSRDGARTRRSTTRTHDGTRSRRPFERRSLVR
jgi:hypothetical protein